MSILEKREVCGVLCTFYANKSGAMWTGCYNGYVFGDYIELSIPKDGSAPKDWTEEEMREKVGTLKDFCEEKLSLFQENERKAKL